MSAREMVALLMKNGGVQISSIVGGTPRVLLDATTSPDKAAAKRAFDAMMPMTKIDVATIEAALRGETVDA